MLAACASPPPHTGLSPLVQLHGLPTRLLAKPGQSSFQSLVKSVVYQQLSGKVGGGRGGSGSTSNLETSNLVASNLETSNLVASKLAASNLVASKLVASNLVASKLVASNLIASNLVASKLVASNLVASNLVASKLVATGCVPAFLVLECRWQLPSMPGSWRHAR